MVQVLSTHRDRLSDEGFPHNVNQAFSVRTGSACVQPVLAACVLFAVSASQRSSGHRSLSAERLFGRVSFLYQHRLCHYPLEPARSVHNLLGQ